MSQVFAIVFVADIVFLLVRSQRSLVEIINNKKSKIVKRVKVLFAKRGLGTRRPSILPSGLGLQNPTLGKSLRGCVSQYITPLGSVCVKEISNTTNAMQWLNFFEKNLQKDIV